MTYSLLAIVLNCLTCLPYAFSQIHFSSILIFAETLRNMKNIIFTNYV